MTRCLLTIITMLAAIAGARCEDSLPTLRPVTSAYWIEVGAAHIADTYLTPLHYRGTHSALQYERTQAMACNPDRRVMRLRLGMVFDQTKNPAKNATMASGALQASWATMWRRTLPCGITAGIGPGTSLDLGVLYLSRNGNNPASAKFGWTLDLNAFASWSTRLWRVPLTLRYQPSLPVAGMFFSPDYGQLYYQIYLGQTGRLMHMAWPGNYFNLDNLLTADLHFGNTSVRVGYHGRVFSSKANDIVSQDITHALVLGITTEWISLRPGSRGIDARIISSY